MDHRFEDSSPAFEFPSLSFEPWVSKFMRESITDYRIKDIYSYSWMSITNTLKSEHRFSQEIH